MLVQHFCGAVEGAGGTASGEAQLPLKKKVFLKKSVVVFNLGEQFYCWL